MVINLIEIGAKIGMHRKLKGLTQQQLAELCKLDRSSISSIENGKLNMTMRTFSNICQALKVNGKDLI